VRPQHPESGNRERRGAIHSSSAWRRRAGLDPSASLPKKLHGVAVAAFTSVAQAARDAGDGQGLGVIVSDVPAAESAVLQAPSVPMGGTPQVPRLAGWDDARAASPRDRAAGRPRHPNVTLSYVPPGAPSDRL